MPEPVRRKADQLRGRTMLVRKADIVPVECIVRGYLAGSGWKEYQASRSRSAACRCPKASPTATSCPEPIFTPTTKAKSGHDMPMTYEEVEAGARRGSRRQTLKRLSLELYTAGAEYAEKRGIILADTKFEFGIVNGRLMLADEALTPDSSRYWDAETYEPGRSQDSFDKQIIRDWLETTDWDKTPPPPNVPQEIIEKAAGRYKEIADRLME